jgi:putative hydrolase of the HAD superfamily
VVFTTSMAPLVRGLIVDYGGVLTTDVFASFRAFCEAEGLAPETVRDRFLGDPQARSLLADLETGRLREGEFEPAFAAVLEVSSEQLIDRLFGGMEPDEAMVDGVRAARDAGVRTAMLSNSWGEDRYDRAQLGELFDVLVISGEVGIRKPDPAIYELAAERLGLAPADCVFVDDLPGNLKPARALGMATVVHRGDAATTLAELSDLLGVPLSPR